MTDHSNAPISNSTDILRQILILVATPLIWICSSIGFFLETARNPSEFSDLTENILVPQTTAFSIWLPIFIGIMAYGCIQAFRANRARMIYRESGWWMAAGLWGVVLWGIVTAFLPDRSVELVATFIFIPTMFCLVTAMTKLWKRRTTLDNLETWLVLAPISLIAGWCSIAVFVGLNGLIWKFVEPLGWSIIGTGLSVLGLALWWAVFVLRQKAINKIYSFPIIWGLSFLVLRHIGQDGNFWISGGAMIGIIAILLAAFIPKQL